MIRVLQGDNYNVTCREKTSRKSSESPIDVLEIRGQMGQGTAGGSLIVLTQQQTIELIDLLTVIMYGRTMSFNVNRG